MPHATSAGPSNGERRMNGPQTTGRDYTNLSEPRYGIRRVNNARVPMRDGTILLADLWLPHAEGTFAALLAASPYPRQIQDLGAPAGVIEAGASDFWVPRGYVHVIANLRGTVGSEGTWTFFDSHERDDLYDIIEWVAEQPWSDGEVGMIGISYYAMTQLEAATRNPPHLKAIFPFDVTVEGREAASHNGLFSSAFITPWLGVLGVLSSRSDTFYRKGLAIARRVLRLPAVHRRFTKTGGESALKGLRILNRLPHPAQPWSQLLANMSERRTRDAWWQDRDVRPLLRNVDIPTYLGSELTNVPLHLPGVFEAWDGLKHNPNVRMALLPDHGLPWPWESMHIEALAWFDQWLKGRQTGILDGPAIRYYLPGAEEWRTSDVWPPTADYREYALNADGSLAEQESAGSLSYESTSTGLRWSTPPLEGDLDMVGFLELQLTASATADDTAWIVLLQDVAPDGTATDVTQGWLRASLREVDVAASAPARPELTLRTASPVPLGEPVDYRIPLVANSRRFAAGHSIRLTLTSDDTVPGSHAMLGFTHTPVGTRSTNTVFASSRLLLPVMREI